MYGQGGSFNPHYRHVAPPPQPPPAAPAATRPFPQQPPPPPLPHYPQHPSLPVQYQHGSPLQNQAYPYPQHGQPYPVPMPMPPQQRGFAPMPMHAPLPQALYRPPPHLPMPGSLPPPPPPPASFAPENVLPPSAPPPPPPPPPSSPPPAPPSPPTAPPAVQSSSVEPNKEEAAPVLIDESLPRGYDGKTEGVAISKAASSDSDMDMEGDEDSPFLQDLSPDMSSFATAGCTGDVNVVKSGNNVDLGDDLPLDSEGKAKSSTVTVEGRSSFQLIQGYASDNSQDSEHTGSANRCTEDSLHKLGNAKRHVNVRPGSEKSTELINHQIKHTSSPMEHNLDEFGRQVNEDLSDSEFDGAQYSAKDGRSQRKRSLSPGSQSRPLLAKRANLHQEQESDRDMECSDFKRSRCFHGASCQYIHRSSEQQTKRQTRYHELNEDPSDTDEHDVSRTSEAQPDANLSKTKDELYNDNHDKCVKDAAPVEIHLVDGEKVLEDDQGDLMGKKKSAGSSIAVNGKEEKGAAPDGAPGEHVHGEILTSGASQSLVASANVSDSLNTKRTGPSSQSQSRSDLDKASPPLLNGDRSLVNQSSTGVPFTSVHATENSMAHDVVHSHPQGLCSPNQMPSGFAPPLPLSSNLSPIPGQPSLTCSEYPQMQFPPNALTLGNEFLKNQMRTYPAPDLSHPKPLDFPRPLQPVIPSHRQPSFHTDELKRPFAVENAAVPLPDRWSDRPGVVSLSYSHHQPSYGQQQPPGSLASGTNMVYSSFQRFPSNLPESSVLVPMSDIGLPKSSIKPHYNPYASTFEQTDVSLNISPGLGPSAVGPASTKAAGHMNPVSPFGQLLPVSAEAVPNLQNQFRPGFASGDPYDPLFDSIEPSSSSINKVDLGQERNLSASDSRNALKHLNTEAESKNKQRVGLIAESEVEELGEVAADAEAGVVENASPEPLGAKDWSIDLPDETNNDESSEKNKKSKDSRSMKLFKNAIADFVKEVLKPSWRQGNMSKEAFKTIVKKTVDKVSSSVPSSHIPKTQAKINQYVQSSQRKMTKLVMGYVDKYVKI